MKLNILIFLLLVSQNIFAAKTIHKISDEDFPANYVDQYQATVVNGKLFFVDMQQHLWVADGTNMGPKKVIIDNKPTTVIYDNSLIAYNNALYFLNRTTDVTLWKTDGVSSERVSDVLLNDRLIADFFLQNGKLYTKTVDGNILIIDENSTSIVAMNEFASYNFKSLCIIDDNHFNVVASDTNSGIFNYNNGVVTQIPNDDIGIDPSDPPSIKFDLQHHDYCLYKYRVDDETLGSFDEYIKISANATGSIIDKLPINSPNVADSPWDRTFVFDNKLILIPRNISSVSGKLLYQLADDSNTPTQIAAFSNIVFSNRYELQISKQNLYFKFFDLGFVEPNNIFVYDKSFSRTTIYRGNDNVPEIITPIEDVLFFNNDLDKIIFTQQGLATEILKTADISVATIVGDDGAIYVFGKDRNNDNKPALYIIADQPLVSRQLTGLWVSAGLDRQGMAINTGVRPDHSTYLFISLYIYREGKPFWVAGNKDIEAGQTTITMDLSEFQGSSFLPNDPGISTAEFDFGQISLTPLACNELDVSIDLVTGENIHLNMNRIIDISNDNICVE
jgi:hypothetical protein